VRRVVGKLFAAVLLTLCVGIHVLEVSGRWDQTFQDANDEAGIVAAMLCVGIAVAVARTLLIRIQPPYLARRVVVAGASHLRSMTAGVVAPIFISPPISLRI